LVIVALVAVYNGITGIPLYFVKQLIISLKNRKVINNNLQYNKIETYNIIYFDTVLCIKKILHKM